MDPGTDRKFLCLVMVVLCLQTTMVVSQDASKQPPLLIKDPVSNQFSGFMVDVLKALGHQYLLFETLDDRTYGIEEVPEKMGDAVDQVSKGKADLAIVCRVLKATNSSGADRGIMFSHPVYTQGFMPIIKKTKWTATYSKMLTLIGPFSPGLWCLIIAMCVLTSGFFFLVRFLSPFEAPKKDRSVPSKSNLMYTISSLFGQDHRDAPRSFSGRVLASVWWIFSMMTAGAYVAGLIIIIFRMNPQINTLPFSTLEEMVRGDDVKVLVVKGGITDHSVSHREGAIWAILRKKLKSLYVDSMDTALKKMMGGDGKYAILLQETTAKYIVNETPCNKMDVTEPFGALYYGFSCKRGPLCDELNKGILHLQSTGTLEKLHEKWFMGLCYKGEDYAFQGLPFVDTFGTGDPVSLNPTTLNIDRFGSAYILLTVGFAAAILVLVAEILYAKWKGPQFFPPKGPGLDDTQRINDQEMTPHRDP